MPSSVRSASSAVKDCPGLSQRRFVNQLSKFRQVPHSRSGKGKIGKTVRIRCGAAAVIGQGPEPNKATEIGCSWARLGKAVQEPLRAISQKTCLPKGCSDASALSI